MKRVWEVVRVLVVLASLGVGCWLGWIAASWAWDQVKPIPWRTHYERRGYAPDRAHPLLALRAYEQVEQHASLSGAFLFATGGFSGSSSTSAKRYVGMILDAGHGQVLVLRFNADKIDYRLDAHARVPRARIWLDKFFEGTDSLTKNMEGHAERVMLSLTPQDFSRDVAVIQYARQGK